MEIKPGDIYKGAEAKFICPQCGYVSEPYIVVTHRGDTGFQCSLCGEFCKTEDAPGWEGVEE